MKEKIIDIVVALSLVLAVSCGAGAFAGIGYGAITIWEHVCSSGDTQYPYTGFCPESPTWEVGEQ